MADDNIKMEVEDSTENAGAPDKKRFEVGVTIF